MSSFIAFMIGLAISHFLQYKLENDKDWEARVDAYINQIVGGLIFLITYQVVHNTWL